MSIEKTVDSARAGWSLLRSYGAAPPSGLPTVPLGDEPLRLTLGPRGEPSVLLPLVGKTSPHSIELPAALSMEMQDLDIPGVTNLHLQITCLLGELEYAFGELVDAIVLRMQAGKDAVAAFKGALDDFRALVAGRGGRIDVGKAAGLAAELLVLQRLGRRSGVAWRTWRGPAKDRHDFRRNDLSLEVKASLSANSKRISINGLNQLAVPQGGSLYLLHLVLEPVLSGPVSVPALVDAVLADADSCADVRDMLKGVGYTDDERRRWEAHTFRLEAETLYAVRDDFPRLVPECFTGGVSPSGVSEISYRLDLSTAAAYIESSSTYNDIERRLTE